MENRKILVVYNICGISREAPAWYIQCIQNLLDQEFDGFHIVVSSCMNSKECFRTLYKSLAIRYLIVYSQKSTSYKLHSTRQLFNVLKSLENLKATCI